MQWLPDELLYASNAKLLRRFPDAALAVRPRRDGGFAKVPTLWTDALLGAKHIGTYRLALHLLHLTWKAGEPTVRLSNVAVAAIGLKRRGKWEALAELEALCLVKVDRRPRRSPVVTVQS